MNKKQTLFNRALRIVSVVLALSVLSSPGCEKDDENLTPNEFLYSLMKDWYFWYQYLPEVNPNDYATPSLLIEAVRYAPRDIWSFVMTTEEYQAYFQDAEYVGFGFSFKFDESEQMRISFVYEGSPMYAQGVRRGWTVEAVDGVAVTPESDLDAVFGADEEGVQKTFTMADNDGNVADYTFTKQVIDIDTIFSETVFDVGGKNVGYFVFNNFIEKSLDELKITLNDMIESGVEDLIVDLRYNGGGLIDVADFLASAIGGDPIAGELFAEYRHNNKHTADDSHLLFIETDYPLNLARVFFITTQSTASASELVINGLDPFMEVYLVGDVTHGKPVGMYGWEYQDYVFFPVAFQTVNADGWGDYFDGLPVDAPALDNVDEPLGSADEDSLAAVLYFIENGAFPAVKGAEESLVKIRELNKDKMQGFRAELGAY